jgi:hypothetical protein
MANILPVAHSLTVCDTTSSFFDIGKKTLYKMCLNAASDGGSLTREESFDKANFTLSLFRSL